MKGEYVGDDSRPLLASLSDIVCGLRPSLFAALLHKDTPAHIKLLHFSSNACLYF